MFSKIKNQYEILKSQYYTIQLIPEGSSHVRMVRISHLYLKMLMWLALVILFFTAILLWKLTEINAVLLTSKYLKTANERLEERHLEYEMAFQELDSIYAMERQIQNILQTYYSNDSGHIASILDQNRFKHISSAKTKLDRSRIYEDVSTPASTIEHMPNILPVIGVITKRFDNRQHKGIDFAAPKGEPVYSTAYGTVVFAGEKGDLGLMAIIDHGNGYSSVYGHMGSLFVKKGLPVKKGETIGTVGITGNTTGPHLHYEVRLDNVQVDPEEYFNHSLRNAK